MRSTTEDVKQNASKIARSVNVAQALLSIWLLSSFVFKNAAHHVATGLNLVKTAVQIAMGELIHGDPLISFHGRNRQSRHDK